MSADNLIDRVAREMTTAVPTPDLARRVRDRIAETPQSRTWGWRLVPVAGLAAAAVILATLTRDTTSEIVPAATTSEVAAAATERNDLRGPVTVTETTSEVVPTGNSARPSDLRGPDVAATAWHARAVPTLPAIEPLAIERIQPTRLSIPLLEVEPLVVPAIGDDK